MEHGSTSNMMYGRTVQNIKPEVGMGCTEIMWTDRRALTIVEVRKSGKSFFVTYDATKRIDKNGFSEIQEYEYTPQMDGTRYEVRQTRDGRWRFKGGGSYVILGRKEEYCDPHF